MDFTNIENIRYNYDNPEEYSIELQDDFFENDIEIRNRQ